MLHVVKPAEKQTKANIKTCKSQNFYGYTKFDEVLFDFVTPVKNLYCHEFKYSGELNQLHQLLGSPDFPEESKAFHSVIQNFGMGDRNSLFVKKFLEAWDSDQSWEELYHRFIREVIKPKMFPNEEELVIQKTPNIRVGVPGVSNIGRLPTDPSPGVIGLHCDGEHGHPPQEQNIIVPLTAMESTNSVFFEPYPNSTLTTDEFKILETDVGKFFYFYGNKCRHFNRINATAQTRVSLDFRVIPFSKFDGEYGEVSATNKNKFTIGGYYNKISC